MLSFFVHPTTAELDNFVLLQHVASGVFAVVLTVVGMASTVLLHMLNVMLVAVPGGSNTVRSTRPDLFFARAFAGDFSKSFHFVDLSETCALSPEMWGTGGGGHPNIKGYLKLQSCFLASDEIMKFSVRE